MDLLLLMSVWGSFSPSRHHPPCCARTPPPWCTFCCGQPPRAPWLTAVCSDQFLHTPNKPQLFCRNVMLLCIFEMQTRPRSRCIGSGSQVSPHYGEQPEQDCLLSYITIWVAFLLEHRHCIMTHIHDMNLMFCLCYFSKYSVHGLQAI